MKAILLDIEGTTTSIDFVHETLFPLSFEKMDSFLRAHQKESHLAPLIAELHGELPLGSASDLIQAISEQLRSWIQEDRKHPILKKIQGFIWQEAYEQGEVKGHVYGEVRECLEAWNAAGLKVGIYSSGSVLAQKLLFSHSEQGDLTPWLSFHFDTQVGGKREKDSYLNIAEQLNLAPSDLLFVSDIPAELKAASQAGLQVCHIVRPGTEPDPNWKSVRNLQELSTTFSLPSSGSK